MRRYLPIMVPLLVVLQLLSSGVLGPRLRCTDADGRVSTELSFFRCCDRGEVETCQTDTECHQCPAESSMDEEGPAAGAPGCNCVDVPDLTDVATSSKGGDTARSLAVAFPVPSILLPTLTLPVFESGPPVAAFLPQGHAPPRLHIATIVLRI